MIGNFYLFGYRLSNQLCVALLHPPWAAVAENRVSLTDMSHINTLTSTTVYRKYRFFVAVDCVVLKINRTSTAPAAHTKTCMLMLKLDIVHIFTSMRWGCLLLLVGLSVHWCAVGRGRRQKNPLSMVIAYRHDFERIFRLIFAFRTRRSKVVACSTFAD